MRYLVVLCILFFNTLQTFGQQDYFIYLQTSNNQPFYVRTNNNVYSSSAAGFLILTRLPDSTSAVTIGFAKNVFPEQQFNVPVNHKDAGYVLSTGADGRWQLLNLQTLAAITSSTRPEEKKNTEINGNKRNDAFSALLANAVNDSLVLYTVVRPPKPVPPVAVEKKPDTAAVVKAATIKDETVTAKKLPGKIPAGKVVTYKDGKPAQNASGNSKAAKQSAVATNKKPGRDSVSTRQDSSAAVRNKIAGTKNPVAKNKTLLKDTAAIAKNTRLSSSANLTKPGVAKDSASVAKNSMPQKRDTIIIMNKPLANKPVLSKNRKERKDTIIMMNGRAPGRNIVKTAAVKKEPPVVNTAATDTVQVIKKQVLQAPEEKRNALLNNSDAVINEKVPVKKDTVPTTTGTTAKKPLAINTDTNTNVPVKRLRPLVTKAAELLTDTSYIAVFVDESTEKFDTVRISIPFNELSITYPKKQIPAVKFSDIIVDTEKNTVSDNKAGRLPATAAKNESAENKTVTDTTKAMAGQTSLPAISKKDSTASFVPVKDSTAKVPRVMRDSGATANKDSIPVMVNREVTALPVKKDSMRQASADSAPAARTAQPLYLNSDCKEVAIDSDIDKLRIKMLLVTTDEDRIALAKKILRQKCFMVMQVKALSELFKTDEGKYKWFDAAYPFTSDTGNFAYLGDLIKDEYYLTRFKAMLRH